MYQRLFNQIKSLPRERVMIASLVVLTVILALWIGGRDGPKESTTEFSELSLTIPKGFLVVPLELANSGALASLVARNAVFDVFQPGEKKAIVENLRVLKLSAGEGPLFGALVPDTMAGALQEIFGRPKLRGAVRTLNSGPTSFHLNSSSKPLLTEISVGE